MRPARRCRGLPLRSSAAVQNVSRATVPAAMCRATKLAYPGMAASWRWGPPDSRGVGAARSPGGHRSAVPEVTFLRESIALPGPGAAAWRSLPPRPAMHGAPRALLQPLNLPALQLLLTAGASIRREAGEAWAAPWPPLAGFSLLSPAIARMAHPPRLRAASSVVPALCALALVVL